MNAGKQRIPSPAKEGPVWDAFVDYWKTVRDPEGTRATAWRAYHAAWNAGREDYRDSFDPPRDG